MKWKGHFQPTLPQNIHGIVIFLFSLEGLMRGLDFFIGDDEVTTQNLKSIELAMPINYWGLIFIFSFIMVSVGLKLQRSLPIIYGSVLNMAIYGALAWGLTLSMIERGWPWDGWRSPFLFICLAIFWALCAYGTRVIVIARERER